MFADSRTYPKLAVSRVSQLVDKADSQSLDVVSGDLQDESGEWGEMEKCVHCPYVNDHMCDDCE